MWFILVTAAVFLADFAIKFVVDKSLHANQSIPVIGNVLSLTYVQNQGAAFGLFWGSTLILIIVGILAIFGIIYFHEHISKNSHLQIPLALLLGGSLGNIVDRVFRSYVVDYIDFHFWPVFNLADIMINISVFLIILHIMVHKEERE